MKIYFERLLVFLLQLQSLIQLSPPAAVTALHLHAEWGLLALGTAHGYALVDTVANKGLLAKSTLNTCSESIESSMFNHLSYFHLMKCGVGAIGTGHYPWLCPGG